MTSRRQTWIGIGVSLLFLIAIFMIIDPAEIWQAMINADLRYLLMVGAAITLFLFLRAVRWRFMLGNAAPYSKVFHIQNIGYLFNFLLPARMGDITRALLIGSVPPIKLAQGLSTMVVERVLDLLFMATILPLTLSQVETLPENLRSTAQTAGIGGLLAIFVLVFAANQRPLARRLATRVLDRLPFLDTDTWALRLDELLLGLQSFTRLRDGVVLLLLSVLVWLPIAWAYYWTFFAVGIHNATLMMGAFVMCISAFSLALPSSPGGVGVYQGGVIFAIATVLGFPADQAAAFSFLHQGMNFLVSLSLGLIGLRVTQSTFSAILAAARQFARRRV